MTEEETIKQCKLLMAKVYKDGFNIYQCLNKLKKQMKLRVDFPPQAIIWTCEAYLRINKPILYHYPWFVRVLKESSRAYFSEENRKNDERLKKEPMNKAVEALVKGIFE